MPGSVRLDEVRAAAAVDLHVDRDAVLGHAVPLVPGLEQTRPVRLPPVAYATLPAAISEQATATASKVVLRMVIPPWSCAVRRTAQPGRTGATADAGPGG